MASPRFNWEPRAIWDDGQPKTPEQITAIRGEREAEIAKLLHMRADDDLLAKAIAAIENIRGIYPKLVANLDQAPRKAAYAKAYSEVAAHSAELLKAIVSLDGWVHGALEDAMSKATGKPLPLTDLEVALASAYDAANALKREYKTDSGGRPRHEALPHAVASLWGVFLRFYQGQRDSRRYRAFERLSRMEAAELAFVKYGLSLLGVRYQNLSRSMREDPRFMPPEKRVAAIEAIAKRVNAPHNKNVLERTVPRPDSLAAALMAMAPPAAKTRRRKG